MSERNMAVFDHARRHFQAKDIQDAVRLQAEFLKAQYEAAIEQLRELGGGVRSSAENLSKNSVEIK
jgi:hypothetical protein